MKRVLAILLAILLMVSLAACAQPTSPGASGSPSTPSSSSASGSSSTPSSSGEKEKVTINGKPASEVVVAGLIHVESYFGSNIIAGMEKACDEYGVQFLSTNYNGDPAKEAEAVNTYIAQNVDAICGSLGESTADLYKQAVDKGITVGALNSSTFLDFVVSSVTYNQASLGEVSVDYAVKFIKENLDSKPVVHMIRVWEGSMADARGDAFMAGLAEAFGEEYGKQISQSSGYVEAIAMQQTLDALTANPNINIIFCECENAAIGAESAIASTGYTGKVYVFAVDGSEMMCEKLLDEKQVIFQGSGAQSPFEMGYTGMHRLLEVLFDEREANPEIEYLKPVAINKGDLATVQEFYDLLVELRTSSGH